MKTDAAPTTRAASAPTRELRAMAAQLITRVLEPGASASQALMRSANGQTLMAVLVMDATGPARLLVGPYGRPRVSTPRRVDLSGLEVATVARALGSCLEAS
jgi:hypothetical protein